MFDAAGLVSIYLGSIVLDRPDQTGRFIAKDLIGGWAYLVGDADGDNRCRGQGVCEGGLDMTLRCAFLSAAGRVPDCRLIRIFVESRQAHQMMVRLAGADPHVIAAIAGRPVSVLTRPDVRASFNVRNAAERAASVVLRAREHTERQASVAYGGGLMPSVADDAPVMTARTVVAATVPDNVPDWRARLQTIRAEAAIVTASSEGAPSMIRRFVSERNAHPVSSAPQPRNEEIRAWLRDFDDQVATISGDLQDAGI